MRTQALRPLIAQAGLMWILLLSTANAQFLQQGPKLVGSGAVGNAWQGYAVALSGDGNTAIIGGRQDNAGDGAAWIFTRSGEVWTQQGGKLVGSGAVGPAYQGIAVALSADGNTAVIGGCNDDAGIGAVWIFVRNGSAWTQQGPKLVGTGAICPALQGSSVSLSADGNTALVGGPGDCGGAAWVFTRSGTSWSQQGNKLVGSGAAGANAAQGYSVALSGDGNTAAIGGSNDNDGAGATWVFTRSGGIWSQQGNKLVGSGGFCARQGSSVDLSNDGGTILIGGPGDGCSNAGASWIFTRTGGLWNQHGGKLLGSGTVGASERGTSVALSADGYTAVVGGYADSSTAGATWVFAKYLGAWNQQGDKLVGTGAAGFARQGFSVSLSDDGKTTIAGGWADNGTAGAAWIYYNSTITRTPVIIIPDFMGSPLFNDVNNDNHLADFFDSCPAPPQSERIWIEPAKMTGTGLDPLQLTINGIDPLNPSDHIKVSPIRNDCHTIGDELGSLPLSKYSGLISDLQSGPTPYRLDNFDDNHHEGEDLFVFAYDWRKSIAWTAETLKTLIDSVTLQWSGTGRVSIVGHGMGGLVVKKYVDHHTDSKVGKIIFVGTPHSGASRYYYSSITGDLQGGTGFSTPPEEIKKITDNFPSAAELFPSQFYFDNVVRPLWSESLNRQLDYSEVRPLFLDFGRNMQLFDSAVALRAELGNIDFGNAEVYNIVGTGLGTMGRINSKSTGMRIDPQWGMLGDGTVPAISAANINGLQQVDHWASNVEHSYLCSDPGIRTAIMNFLQSVSPLPLVVPPATYTSNYSIKVDHEVALHVYDSLGNHTGATSDTTWETNIPGSEYIPGDVRQAGSVKAALLPRGGNYRFAIEAHDTASYFNLVLDDIVNGVAAVSIAYDSIPTLPNTIARATFRSIDADLNLVVDKFGDSSDLNTMSPTNILLSPTTRARWNLVSIPLAVSDSSASFLFPTATSNAYWYNPGIGYQAENPLQRRRGYWMTFNSPEVVSFYGAPRLADTIPVQAGWNLIGTISSSVLVKHIATDPPNMITSQFFGYSTSYYAADTLDPCKGYWVKVNETGLLILSAEQNQLFNRINIITTSELPPSPPGETRAEQKDIPRQFALHQNYPNPFNPSTVITYSLPVDLNATLKIYNLLGEEVATLVDALQTAGTHEAAWSGGSEIPSGVYYYRLSAGSFVGIRKLVLMR